MPTPAQPSIQLRQIGPWAVRLTRSISVAAKALPVTQPAVSRLVSHAEQRLGFRLFERIKGRIFPTPEAELLFNAFWQMRNFETGKDARW